MIIVVLCVSLLWAIAATFEKNLLESTIAREQLLLYISIIVFVCNFVTLALDKDKALIPKNTLTKSVVAQILVIGILGFQVAYSLFFHAISQNTPLYVLALTNTTAIFALFLTKHAWDAKQVIGTLTGAASAILVTL